MDGDATQPAPDRVDPTARPPQPGAKLTDPRDLTRPSSASEIVVDVGAGIGFDPTFASLGQRALGAIVDTVVLLLAVAPGLALLLLGPSALTILLGAALAVVGYLVVVKLGGRALATNGKWIGNRVAGTTVVDAINGSFVDPSRGSTRMLVRHGISWLFFFGYVSAFTDGQRRTFHDRVVGTVVIQRQREVWTSDDG